ncbi:glycoside hydrolase family 11 protein [Daldinia vernicosa]|uniref:glycoside hydrolase family 11 protein n=1 Tax=Daldinia vernicosa TaxID=114800 RepID=UPI0020081AFD|nr:glycoside hydrolase family 11 protein [Daldinia vernicosa]KAI0847444.1 glycoside hydrolase family 11 protein [Daldinia vernicosa]
MLPSFLLTAAALIPGAFTAPSGFLPQIGDLFHGSNSNAIQTRQGGYFWSSWSEGGGTFRCNNGAGSSYSVTWQSSGGSSGFVCGKGWSPGGNRAVTYSGTYEPKGPSYLAVYGWTRNPLIEYYILDAHGDLLPNEPWTSKGNFTIDEGTYEVYTSTRVNKPSIIGTTTFQQYWSVRTEQRVGGTINTGKHFDQWSKLGLNLGGHDYMILATEGYTSGSVTSNGTSSITLG